MQKEERRHHPYQDLKIIHIVKRKPEDSASRTCMVSSIFGNTLKRNKNNTLYITRLYLQKVTNRRKIIVFRNILFKTILN